MNSILNKKRVQYSRTTIRKSNTQQQIQKFVSHTQGRQGRRYENSYPILKDRKDGETKIRIRTARTAIRKFVSGLQGRRYENSYGDTKIRIRYPVLKDGKDGDTKIHMNSYPISCTQGRQGRRYENSDSILKDGKDGNSKQRRDANGNGK